LEAIVPTETRGRIVRSIQQKLKNLSSIQPHYDALHFRFEKDWIQHCDRWMVANENYNRDNCGIITASNLINQMLAAGFGTRPVFVAVNELQLPAYSKAILSRLKLQFQIKLKSDLLRSYSSTLSTAESALIDYQVSLNSGLWMGNSHSLFSALLILERQYKSRTAIWYNKGSIPIASFMPIFKAPWLFTFSNESNRLFDDLLLVSVWTAVNTGNVIPFCSFFGAPNLVSKWLEHMGVVVHYQTSCCHWSDKFSRLVQMASEGYEEHPLIDYNSDHKMIAKFQRKYFSQHPAILNQYVIFSDVDTMFLRYVDIYDIPLATVVCIGMTKEKFETPRYNTGVILLNMDCIHETDSEFREFVAKKEADNGKTLTEFGNGYPDAVNQFYELQIQKISPKWNAKPYHSQSKDAVIVHFDGPKPIHYRNKAYGTPCPNFFERRCEEGMSFDALRLVHIWESELREARKSIDDFILMMTLNQ
jgi:hypothetical protein